MSVFRSVSKSVFPSVHRATNVPAALLGGGAPSAALAYNGETITFTSEIITYTES